MVAWYIYLHEWLIFKFPRHMRHMSIPPTSTCFFQNKQQQKDGPLRSIVKWSYNQP